MSDEFIDDAAAGFARAPMSVRVSPYLLCLIDWEHPYDDPLRTQFIPLGSRLLPDHPKLGLDSLHEQDDAPVPGLTHRYPDKALFLPLDTCPVYCRFCTRSYAVGVDTEEVEKIHLKVDEERWQRAFAYIASRPELEDIVVSGGDAYNLRAEQIDAIGDDPAGDAQHPPHPLRHQGPGGDAAEDPHRRRVDRRADRAWSSRAASSTRRWCSTPTSTIPNEITGITEGAMNRLFERGITVRNQSVLQRGVNDTVETMKLLVKRLGHVNVHPYYVYVHDLVKGVEDLRTTLADRARCSRSTCAASTAGFNTPTFVVDAPGGGGKRDAHSFEHYDRETGISVYAAPAVKPGELYLYFDPVDSLSPESRARWSDPAQQEEMIQEALSAARVNTQ